MSCKNVHIHGCMMPHTLAQVPELDVEKRYAIYGFILLSVVIEGVSASKDLCAYYPVLSPNRVQFL